MAHTSPLRRLHQEAEASVRHYGPAEAGVELVETYGELELEYAAVRKSCVLLDQPQRATLELTGRERLDFLNRMITQEMKGMAPFRVRRSFWLNRKGRIDADLRVIDLPRRTLLDLDVHAAERTLAGLREFIVGEDVRIEDITEKTHRLALHGPTAMMLLRAVSQHASGADASGPAFGDLVPDWACVIRVAGHEVVVDRDDSTGEVGLEVLAPLGGVPAIYSLLIEHGCDPGVPKSTTVSTVPAFGSRVKLRPAGWHAYNIARVEAGRPLYNIDFGPDSLPAETGVLEDRVSFTKGCYLGQEIVARMQHVGHPKQKLVAIRLETQQAPPSELSQTITPRMLQPLAGAEVRSGKEAEGAAIGAVTSSSFAPMLGGIPVCFAMVKWDAAAPGTEVVVPAEGASIRGVVQPTLRFWSKR